MTEKEEIFHDNWAASINPKDVLVDESFDACTAPENRQIMKWLGDISNKVILDLGCGAGEAAVYFAKKGAKVTASDSSSGMLQVVQKVAAYHKVSVITKKADSDELPFEDNTFDIVYAANLLHHVNIEKTIKAVKRILKKDGVFVSYDPVAYNPLINVYRAMATETRTKDEHPLTFADVKTIRNAFPSFRCKGSWFFTLWIFLKYYLIDRIDPNKERYWKKILTDHKILENTYLLLEKADKMLFGILPFMKYFGWNITIFAKKL